MIYGNPLIFGGSGGGSGPSASDAILTVTVPTSSTVTATKGSVTLTPTMWVQAADATLDCALFSIPAAQFDATTPWTVTATLGTDTASDSVTVSSNKQYDIILEYGLYLIKNNQLVLPVTTTTYANVSQTDNGYKVQHNGSAAAYRGAAYWQLTDSVLGGKTFAKLLLDVNEWTGVANNDYSGFGLVKDYSATGGTVLAFMKAYGNDLTKTLTLDISAYSLVNNYVSIRASESSHYVLIRNLYLSR